jgi:Cof subfamily protein (haloacid dehalogenase superfamily)
MPPRLLAFDLDGTLLTNEKKLSDANRAALFDMKASGSVVALASGRLRSSMMRYARELDMDIAMLSLNGAAVYTSSAEDAVPVHTLDLPEAIARQLIDDSRGKDLVLNYYRDDMVYAMQNRATTPWISLYVKQTGSKYRYVESYEEALTKPASKIIFVGNEDLLDSLEKHYRATLGDRAYVCRTWNWYLEFLHPQANKGSGIAALAKAFGVTLADVAAFGDAENDIPMLEVVGHPVAMANAEDHVKAISRYVSPYTNEQDGVAREWERLKGI